jgi:hypothetical protein
MIDGDAFLPQQALTMYSGYVNTWDAGSVFGFGRPTTDDYDTFWGWRVQGNEDLDFTKNKTGSLDVLPNRPTGDWNWYWTYYANQQLGFNGKWGGWQWGEYNPFLHENLPPRESYPNGVFGYYAPNWYAGANTLLNHYGTLPNGLYLREWMHPIWDSWAAAAHKKNPGADLRLTGVDFWGEEVGAAAPQPSHMEAFLQYMQEQRGVTLRARTWAELCNRIRADYGDAWATWSQSNLTMASQTLTKAEVEKGLGQRKAVWWNQNTGPAIWLYTTGSLGSPYSSPTDLEEWGQDWARLIDFPSSDGGMTGGMPEGKGYRCWSVYETFWKAAIPTSNRAWMWNTPGSYWKDKGVDTVEKLRRFFLQPAFTAIYDRHGRLTPVLNITAPHHSGAGWDHLMAYWPQRPPVDRAQDVETVRRVWELTEALGVRDRLGPVLVVSSRRSADDRAGTEFDTRKLGEFVSRLRDAGVGISTFVDAAWADQLPAGTPTVTAPRYDGNGHLVVGVVDHDGNSKLLRYPGSAGDWQALAQAILAADPSLGFEDGITGYGMVSQYGPLVLVENPDTASKTGTFHCALPAGTTDATAVELFSCTLLKTEVRNGQCRVTVPMGAADGRLVLVVPRRSANAG